MTALPTGRLRVALVSTSAVEAPGSMRAYADTLMTALSNHAPDIHAELVELNPSPMSWRGGQRIQTMLMPVRAWLERGRAPDVWHVLDGSRAYVARALGSAPVVVTAHDVIPWLQASGKFPGAPPLGIAARRLWRSNGLALQRSALAVCVSACAQHDVQDAFALAPGKSVVVHHALRPAMADRVLHASEFVRKAGIVLHVGNNGFYKNRAGVLRIFSKLDSQIANRLVMAGPAPTVELLRIAHELGISDRIEWFNDPSDDTLARLYRQSSVLLFPSLYEGFGWPVLEAMAFGLPVVVSDAGSLPEVVGDASTGLPLDDEQRFVSAVEQVLCSPEFARAAAQRGLARAQEFSSTAFADGMRHAYLLAIENDRRSRKA